MMSDTTERALRAHIQGLLLNYALTHLTTDYIAYTHNAVVELLVPALNFVSATDPSSITLERSIPDSALLCFGISQVSRYSEQWAVDPHVQDYVKQRMIMHGKPPSVTYWSENAIVEATIPRPYSPVLSLKAIKQTPRLGLRTAADYFSRTTRSFVQQYGLSEVEDETEDVPPIDIDDALHNRPRVDQEAVQLAKSIGSSLPCGRWENNDVRDFLRCDSPSPQLPPLLDVPLFPRSECAGGESPPLVRRESRAPGMSAIKDLPSVLPKAPSPEDAEGELYKEHMKVVNGWHTIENSSPLLAPTPSLDSSSQEEVDELLLESPPGTSYIRDLLDAQLTEVEFPQSSKIRGARRQDSQGLGEGQSFPAFLANFNLAQTSTHEPRIVRDPKSVPSSPRTSITASMLGQLGDASDIGIVSETVKHDTLPTIGDGEDLDGALRTLFKDDLPKDPKDYILNERLDDRESLLMDVPNLPPPTSGLATGHDLPRSLSQLTLSNTPSKSKLQDHSAEPPLENTKMRSYTGFLKPIKGFKSLNMELSWRPFNYGSSVPTHEEVSRLGFSIRTDCVQGMTRNTQDPHGVSGDVDKHITILLEAACLDEPRNSPSEEAWIDEVPDSSPMHRPGSSWENFVLSAAERRHLDGYPDPIDELSQESSTSEEELPSGKRHRVDKLQGYEPALPDVEEAVPPIRSVRFDERIYEYYRPDYEETLEETFEDSGVYLHEHGDNMGSATIGTAFGGLAEGSEDFQGPEDDGDVLPDIDPIHMTFGCASPMHFTTWPEYLSTGQDIIFDTEAVMPMAESEPIHTQTQTVQEDYHRTYAPLDPPVPRPPLASLPAATDSTQSVSRKSSPASALVQSASQSLRQFMKMRSRVLGPESYTNELLPDSMAARDLTSLGEPSSMTVPSELLDIHTLTIADSDVDITYSHRYLASLDFIQKHGLVRALSRWTIDLVEREFLGGVDLILDQDTAVLFIPLRTLPAQSDTVSTTINCISWQFFRILVVYEAFPSSAYFRTDNNTEGLAANPFSPAVVKAVKKIRRNLGIAEACQDKRSDTTVHATFSLNADEAAKAVRTFGNMAQSSDTTGGLLWGERHWMDQDEEDSNSHATTLKDEWDLATIDGMNVFAAAVILSYNNLDDFLEKTPQERMAEFGPLIGTERMTTFNRVIARRMEAIQLPSSSPPMTSVDTSNSAQPLPDAVDATMEADTQAWS